MSRIGAAVLVLSLPLLGGCIGFALEGSRDNLPRALNQVHKLEAGRSTLREALEKLGPPDVLLRVRDLDRLYYVSWDSLSFKFSISAPVPFPGRSVSTDAFILGIGSEEFRLARLEFDRQGVLRYVQTGDFVSTTHGEYFVIDNRIVETFLEDRARALGMLPQDDDDDDLDAPKEGQKK
jgi:hypothetical protein